MLLVNLRPGLVVRESTGFEYRVGLNLENENDYFEFDALFDGKPM